MSELAPSKYYLAPEVVLKNNVLKIYDDKIIIADRPDFSYDHVWKPLLVAVIYLLSFYFNQIFEYLALVCGVVVMIEKFQEPENQMSRTEHMVISCSRAISIGVLCLFGIKYLSLYLLITESIFYLRFWVLNKENTEEYIRHNIQTVELTESTFFLKPAIHITFLDKKQGLKTDKYVFANNQEFKEAQVVLKETGMVTFFKHRIKI